LKKMDRQNRGRFWSIERMKNEISGDTHYG